MPKDYSQIILSNKEPQTPEIFLSLQGEGPEIGRPSVFIRLSGCNLYCIWCDTAYTWNWEGTNYAHEKDVKYNKKNEQSHISIEMLVNEIKALNCKSIVITGGEPLAQQTSLVDFLKKMLEAGNYQFDIETNATIIPSNNFDQYIKTYVCSPKLKNAHVPENLRIKQGALEWFANSNKSYFKFVVANQTDLDEINNLVEQFTINKDRIYLMSQAIDIDQLSSNDQFVADKCIEYGYRYSDRLHLRLYGDGRGV